MEKQVLNHPKEALKILSQIDGIPEDSLRIIQYHHELPGGKGFPSGYDAMKLDRLSLTFLISEDFVFRYFHAQAEDIESVFSDLEQIYDSNYGAEVVSTLRIISA